MGKQVFGEETTPTVILCTTNPTCTSLELNLSFRIERPTTNRLRHGTVAPVIVVINIIIVVAVVVVVVVVAALTVL
jgi:hypothetical protein